MERMVEHHQMTVGRFLRKIHSRKPDKMGALPIAVTVPMATPVRVTAEKNNGWYNAMQSEAIRVFLMGQFFRSSFPARRTMHNKNKPPAARRAAPMAIGCAFSGANACVVPVVPRALRQAIYKMVLFSRSCSHPNKKDKRIIKLILENFLRIFFT